MSTLFELSVGGEICTVKKKVLERFFLRHHELRAQTRYEVQTMVPFGILQEFVAALDSNTKIPVTQENSTYISCLKSEFCLDDSISDQSSLQSASPQCQILNQLVDREEFTRITTDLRSSIQRLEHELEEFRAKVKRPQSTSLSTPSAPIPPGTPTPRSEIQCACRSQTELFGIIAYLTQANGNVVDNHIIAIASKSVASTDEGVQLRNLTDFTTSSSFRSNNVAYQWISWDFQKRLVRMTHYTIWSKCDCPPNSWMIEGSIDDVNWIELDRRTVGDLGDKPTSYPVRRSMECRFVRMTQTGTNAGGSHLLILNGFEIFGALIE
jgi:hypothetical protein